MTIDASAVQHIVKDHGQSVTFRRVTEGSYDPAAGETTGGSTDDETVTVAFVDYRENMIDGTTIERGDRKALMANNKADGTALNKTPKPGDEFVGAQSTVRAINVKRLEPGGTLVGFEIQCRE